MSFYEDYVADGLCCESCGALIDMDEPGHARLCAGCQPTTSYRNGSDQCTGRNRKGKRCNRAAIPGGRFCSTHGVG